MGKTTTTTDQNQSFDQSQNSSQNGYMKPVFDEQTAANRNLLSNLLRDRLSFGVPEQTEAYKNKGIANINAGGDAKAAILGRLLTSRGLGRTSMGGSVLAQNESQRIGDITNFENTDVPQYADNLVNSRLQQLMGYTMSSPYGQESHGDATATSEGSSQMHSTQVQKTPFWQDLMGVAAYLGGAALGGGFGGGAKGGKG